MPRNGSGVYSLPSGSIVANGDTTDASQHNTPLNDLVTDANAARPIVAGGTGGATEAVARKNLGVLGGGFVEMGGDAVAYTVATGGSHNSYAEPLLFFGKPPLANTGAVTLNVDGLGAKDIKIIGVGGLQDPPAGYFQPDTPALFGYDLGEDAILAMGGGGLAFPAINALAAIDPTGENAGKYLRTNGANGFSLVAEKSVQLWGHVNGGGAIIQGSGFSVAVIAPGSFRVTFSPAQPDALYLPLVTPADALPYHVSMAPESGASALVSIVDTSGNPYSGGFRFAVIR